MNDVVQLPVTESHDPEREPAPDRIPGAPPKERLDTRRRRWGGRLLALGAFLVLAGGLAFGASRYYAQHRQVMATAQQQRDFVPSVRVATLQPSPDSLVVTLPATTLALTTANIYARATGYIVERHVDIGDRVKVGQLLVNITAPEIDHQIAQSEATIAQNNSAVQQAQASLELARVTWNRDQPLVKEGWATQQQGTIDVQTVKSNEAAVAVAKANVAAQEALLRQLTTQKSYLRVIAPFDGVITQRNVNVGDLVQANATSGTFMFTAMQTDVIRTQVYVPQDQAFGLGPGVDAVVRVPEIPGRTFSGKVTRTANALQPGTRTLLTEIEIPNPDGALTPGTYVTVELHIPRKTPSVLVPADAIIFNRDGLQVAVIEDGTARIRKISVARDLGTQVEIRDGVKQGDQVILNPSVGLTDGSKVQARPEPAGPSNSTGQAAQN
jgi:RND family efflux transporter MFP subunit